MNSFSAVTADVTPSGTVARLERLASFLRVDPDNLRLRRDYASCALQCNQPALAAESLAIICRRPEVEPDDFAAYVSALRRIPRVNEARDISALALQRWPSHDWLRLEAALLDFAQGEYEAALLHLPQLTEDPALFTRIAETRIRLLHHLGRLEDALQFAEALLQNTPNATRILACICPVLLDLGNFERAVTYANRVLAVDGTVYEILETLASAAINVNDNSAAEQYLQIAFSMRQDDGRIWLLKGLACMQRRDFDLAAGAFDRAIQLMPGHAGSHLARGWNLVALGRPDDAMKAFDSAIASSPAFSEAHGSKASLHALTGDVDSAQAMLRKARLLNPEAATVQYVQALLHNASEEQISELAQQIIERARRTNQS